MSQTTVQTTGHVMGYRLRQKLAKYGAITAINFQNQLAYIWDTLNRSLFIIFIMFIFAQLWQAVYATRTAPEIAGLTLPGIIWYLLVAEMMELGKFRHDLKISEEVKDGSIAYTLVRPYHYLAYHFFNGLGETIVRMALVFGLGLPVVLYYAGRPDLELWQLPPILLVVLGAMLIDFCVLSTIGLLAFFTEDTASFRMIYQKFVFVIGGLMFPIDFLPDWLQWIARLLPFHLTTYAPARLFVDFSWTQFNHFLLLQLVWLGILGTILWVQYRSAARRLAVNGG